MAYISTEEMKSIREEVKKVLTPKDGFKISISRRHYSVVVVRLVKSPLPINHTREQVNHYHLHRIECKNTRTIFELIDKAITRVTGGVVDRNANDPGADYANCNFFLDYGIELS